MQNLCLNVIENLYRANDAYALKEDTKAAEERLSYQHSAATDLRLLSYIAMVAMEQQCILPKQYEQIAKPETNVYNSPPEKWKRNLQP